MGKYLLKEDFIKLYGEEAWKEKMFKHRESGRKYYNKNKDKVCEKQKDWRENNPEKWQDKLERMKLRRKKEVWIKEKGEDWYEEHILAPGRENAKNQRIKNPDNIKNWRLENKEHISEYNKKWKENNPEYQPNYRKSQIGKAIGLAASYRQHDAENGLDSSNNLTHFWIIENIFTTKCVYCGDSDWRHLGCDRIDNSKPHTPENVICACRICNIDRSDRMGVEEFKEYRRLHPRACDIPKAPAIQLSETGAIKKRPIN